jgi:hypothetical protein
MQRVRLPRNPDLVVPESSLCEVELVIMQVSGSVKQQWLGDWLTLTSEQDVSHFLYSILYFRAVWPFNQHDESYFRETMFCFWQLFWPCIKYLAKIHALDYSACVGHIFRSWRVFHNGRSMFHNSRDGIRRRKKIQSVGGDSHEPILKSATVKLKTHATVRLRAPFRLSIQTHVYVSSISVSFWTFFFFSGIKEAMQRGSSFIVIFFHFWFHGSLWPHVPRICVPEWRKLVTSPWNKILCDISAHFFVLHEHLFCKMTEFV